ncbi:MAG: hypothetical protein AAF663_01780 [Planctomycetota bacterium]
MEAALCLAILGFVGGTWAGWSARRYVDLRTRFYWKLAQRQHAARSALDAPADPPARRSQVVGKVGAA